LTVQVAVEPLPLKVHWPFDGVKVPVEVGPCVNWTVPVGVDGVPDEVSVTVTVQVVDEPRATEVGLHDTTVEVSRAHFIVAEPVLAAWSGISPG
jgi:hypothetical protein